MKNSIKKLQYGIFNQIMALIILSAVILAVLMFASINFLLNMQEQQLNQTIEMLKNEIKHEEDLISVNQDKKIDAILSMLTMLTPDLIWAYDFVSLNLYAKNITKDTDINSVTFLGTTGNFLAGDKNSSGNKIIRRDIKTDGEKLGTIVIGINTDSLDQNLLDVENRITGFEQIFVENIRKSNRTLKIINLIMVIVLIGSLYIISIIIKNIIGPIKSLSLWTRQVADGNLSDFKISTPKNEISELNTNFSQMVDTLRKSERESNINSWLKKGQSLLDEQMRGNQTIEELSLKVLTFIANYFEAIVGAMYVNNGRDVFTFAAGYSFTPNGKKSSEFSLGDGYIGQTALDRQLVVIEQVPDGYMRISSGLGYSNPATVLLQPFIYNEQVVGVMELGSFNKFTEIQIKLLQLTANPIAIAMHVASSRVKLQNALSNAQQLNEESKAQQMELQAANEEYEKQSNQLQSSEEELRVQQEELRSTNEELLKKTKLLEDKLKAEENK